MWLSSHYTLMDVRGGNELFGAGTTTCAATFNGILFTSFISLQMWLSSHYALILTYVSGDHKTFIDHFLLLETNTYNG